MKKQKEKIYVKPAEGKKVRLPASLNGALMPEEGMLVPDDSYWRRRQRGGDVIKCKAPTKPKTAVKTEPTEKVEPKGAKK